MSTPPSAATWTISGTTRGGPHGRLEWSQGHCDDGGETSLEDRARDDVMQPFRDTALPRPHPSNGQRSPIRTRGSSLDVWPEPWCVSRVGQVRYALGT